MTTFKMKSSQKSLIEVLTLGRITMFHSMVVLVSAVNIYAFLYGVSMVELPTDLIELMEKHIRIDPLKYITFWNMVLQSLYFSLALLTDLTGLNINSTLTHNQNRLQYIRDLAFACWLFPLGMWVCSSFWMLFWMYSELILPNRMATLFPAWVNHGVHSMPAVFAIMELYLVQHKYPTRRTGLLYLTGFYIAYLLYMVTMGVVSGMWPYPVMTELAPLQMAVLFIILVVSAAIVYIFGENFSILLCEHKTVKPLNKMPKRKSHSTAKLHKKIPCFKRGRDICEAECLVCIPRTYVTVENKGCYDLEVRVNTAKHKKAVQEESTLMRETDIFVKPGSDDAVTAAEGAYVFHTVKHHNSIMSMNCSSSLVKRTFFNSEVARKFSSARTKTEAMVNSMLPPHSVNSVMKKLEKKEITYFGVATNESIHNSTKVFPVIIQYFDWKTGGLQSKLIEFKNTPNETTNNISNYLKETLEKMDYLKTVFHSQVTIAIQCLED